MPLKSPEDCCCMAKTDLYFFCRSKRGILKYVCVIFDVGSAICSLVGAVSFACKPLKFMANLFTDLTGGIVKILGSVENFFRFKIKSNLDISGSINISKNASTVVTEIQEDLFSRTQPILDFFTSLNNILILSLLFLFFKSLFYVKNYRTKDRYDNIYITGAFEKFDEECKKKGYKTVLPLKEREKTKYIFTRSKVLSMIEVMRLKKGLVKFGYHMVISALVFGFDFVLFYVLRLLSDYADMALTVEGLNIVQIDVQGRGFLSGILRFMVNNMNLNSTYNVTFNFTTCLPKPNQPDYSTAVGILFLYVIALFCTLLQGYGKRVRRKIASSFYPEQEVARIHYLHEKIIHGRLTFRAWMKELVFRRRKEHGVMERVTLRGFLASRFRCFEMFCSCLLPVRRACNCCDALARSGMVFRKCLNKRCNAVFCGECFAQMKNHCFVCETKQEIELVYDDS